MSNDDVIIKDMATRMKVKFDKYWSEYNIVLALGVVLDPRMKLQLVEHLYQKLDLINYNLKVTLVNEKLYKLFGEYMNNRLSRSTEPNASGSHSQPPMQQRQAPIQTAKSKGKGAWLYDDLEDFDVLESSNIEKSQLDVYLGEQKLELEFYSDLDVLDWWKTHAHRYPDLSLMACDVLSIPITTVASESSFSIAACVLSKYRSSLLPRNVKALICTWNWLQGFDYSETDDEKVVEATLSKEDSNVLPNDEEDEEDN